MAEKYISKVIYDGRILMDISGDTVAADKLLSGFTAHGKDGAPITGSCPFDMDTSEMTAAAAELLAGKKAGVHGAIVTGTMPNNGAVTGSITTKAGQYTVPKGYHDGSGKVGISATEQAKIVANNIRSGVTILGVAGNMSGTEGVKAEAKSVTPTSSSQEILPGSGYNYIASVTVAAIPYSVADNAAGGQTVTIG